MSRAVPTSSLLSQPLDFILPLSFISVIFSSISLSHSFTENLPLSGGTTLPVGPGPLQFSEVVSIPSIAPAGPYMLHLTFQDQNNTPLTCIQIKFKLTDGKYAQEIETA